MALLTSSAPPNHVLQQVYERLLRGGMAPKKRSAAQLDSLAAGRAKKIKANAAARLASRADDEQAETMQIDANAAGVPVLHARDRL